MSYMCKNGGVCECCGNHSPLDEPGLICDECGEPIYDGDRYYKIGEAAYCEDCVERGYRRA